MFAINTSQTTDQLTGMNFTSKSLIGDTTSTYWYKNIISEHKHSILSMMSTWHSGLGGIRIVLDSK